MKPHIHVLTLGVSDLPRSIRFYRDGLRFPTGAKDDDPIAHFATAGTKLELYPLEKLAEDIGPGISLTKGFSGVTLAHGVRTRAEVAEVVSFEEKAGSRIVKPAQDVFWGGHSGYFADPDGHYWEVAWAPNWTFDEAGHLIQRSFHPQPDEVCRDAI